MSHSRPARPSLENSSTSSRGPVCHDHRSRVWLVALSSARVEYIDTSMIPSLHRAPAWRGMMCLFSGMRVPRTRRCKHGVRQLASLLQTCMFKIKTSATGWRRSRTASDK